MALTERTYTEKDFNRMKNDAMLKLVLHMRDPEHFGIPKVTLDDISTLQADCVKNMKSRMSICKTEQVALMKCRNYMNSHNLKSMSDCIDGPIRIAPVQYGGIV